MGDEFKKVIILADYGSISLAQEIHNELSKRDIHGGIEPFSLKGIYINRFANREIDLDIASNVRGKDVFLLKSFNVCTGAWDKSMAAPDKANLVFSPTEAYSELFLLNDALKRGEASSVTNILPFMPYQRQDRRPKRDGKKTRSAISAKVFANILKETGANRVINLDPHFKQIEGFYDIAFEGLDSFVIFAEYIEANLKERMKEIVFVAPDHGSAERGGDYASYFKRPLMIIDKRRVRSGVSEAKGIIGDTTLLKGALCILTDDLIDGGGTIVESAKILKENGAGEIIAFCTHPVLSGTAKEKLLQNKIKLVTTESILIPEKDKYPNITVLGISYLIAQAIWCICNGKSVSQHLFDYDRYKEYRNQATQIIKS
ncbi:MAG TPA: ribose-phosphate diphosphokinase [Nanoarchaeota archaeon]|nr:ribose-phosphate diphosphokinase [Nanoarchaeota archaeon]